MILRCVLTSFRDPQSISPWLNDSLCNFTCKNNNNNKKYYGIIRNFLGSEELFRAKKKWHNDQTICWVQSLLVDYLDHNSTGTYFRTVYLSLKILNMATIPDEIDEETLNSGAEGWENEIVFIWTTSYCSATECWWLQSTCTYSVDSTHKIIMFFLFTSVRLLSRMVCIASFKNVPGSKRHKFSSRIQHVLEWHTMT